MSKYVSVASPFALAIACVTAAWSPASAADLGDYNRSYKDYGEPIVVPPTYFSWTGFYLGAHLGYGMGTGTSIAATAGAFDGAASALESDPTGWLGGATLGYNWQVGSFVYGIEGDLGFMGVDDEKRTATAFTSSEYGGYGVLSGRLGYAEDRWLLYTKLGVAFADIANKAGAVNAGVNDVSDLTKLSEVRSGWALGVGFEHAFQKDLSLKVEYLYMDFGDDKSSNIDGDLFKHENDIHTLKIGLNYSLQRTYEPLR